MKQGQKNTDAGHLLGLVRIEEDWPEEVILLVEKAIGIKNRATPFHHNIARFIAGWGLDHSKNRLLVSE